MWNIRTSVPKDIPAQRQLWKLAFGDEDAYIDNFTTPTTVRSG